MKTNSNIKFVGKNLTNTPFTYSSGDISPFSRLNPVHSSNKMKLYNNDCLDVIHCLQCDSIDLLITSPPYNVNLGKNKFNKSSYDLYNDNKDHKEYILWMESIFDALYSKLKKGSRICINIGDGKNGKVPTHSDIIQFMTKIGYLPFANIIWNKGQVGSRCSWGSWMSPSSPSFVNSYEFILIFAKESKKLQAKGETDLERQEFIDWSLGIWNIKPETQMKKIGHPAMMPLEIPKRLIKMLSWKDSTVFDPFNGAGTTGLACQLLNRKYIAAELSSDYCEISVNRWQNAKKAA
jgi:site-specific DNA-methyltransferase (adenine-specific)